MSDASAHRRQPPSPLVFSPDTVLAPISTQSNAPKHGSGQNTVSMPFIKRHVTRRLKTAKQECDKDLQRVTNAITAFFEERLREGEVDRKWRLVACTAVFALTSPHRVGRGGLTRDNSLHIRGSPVILPGR